MKIIHNMYMCRGLMGVEGAGKYADLATNGCKGCHLYHTVITRFQVPRQHLLILSG
jgi:hypothetical protein